MAVGSSAQLLSQTGRQWAVLGLGMLFLLLLWRETAHRRRAERAALELRVELDRLSLVTQRTSHVVAMTNARQCITWINDGFEMVTGYAAKDALGRNVVDLLPGSPESDAGAQSMQQALDAQQDFAGEVLSKARDGRPYWLAMDIEPLRDKAGNLTGYMLIGQDITQRKHAEAALRDSHAFLDPTGRIGTQADRGDGEHVVRLVGSVLEGAIKALDEAFVLYDPQDRLVMCNERFKTHYSGVVDLIQPGARFEDLVRTGALRGHYPEAIDRIEAWVSERIALHREAAATVIRRLSNGRTLRIIERRLPDGHIVGFHIDITELVRAREQAEAASRASRQALARLQAIYDVLPVGIMITDPTGQTIDCNPAYERMLGVTKAVHQAGHYGGKSWRVLREDGSVMPPEQSAVARALRDGRPIYGEIEQLCTANSRLWLSVNAMPAAHEDLGVVVGFVDITEQRAQQAALENAKAQAELANVAKSHFLANMSHEIRTPMNAILGMLSLLDRTGLNARQADYRDKTESAARSLLRLLNDILDFSKVEAGKMMLDPQPFRMDRLMREMGIILSANLGDKPVELLFRLDPALPRELIGDALRLQQVLLNLAGNAVKFTDRGEVLVVVRVHSRRDNHVRLYFEVTDTGIGIAPENQARIFGSFTQAEASTTRRFGGTGLGVAISQRLIHLMGGELQLRSALEQGSTFHFEIDLPIGESVAAAESSPVADVQAPRRALVVDDNDTAREVLAEMCASLGWTCDTAEGGKTALAMLADKSKGYDAIFVDWQMPDMDGWQTTQRIRAEGLGGDAPVLVMVTAHGRERLEQRSADEQALLDGYLVKPVTASMLLDALVDARGGLALAPTTRPSPGLQRLSGLRILLVEDNANNQQVARELLEDEGASVALAHNGQQAVTALTRATPMFDLVLMDLQMPVMDGLTATAAIRHELGLTDLPIVAMTANAMPSDQEACLAAGMNDHVGKPFDLDNLIAVIDRLCGLRVPVPQRTATDLSALGPLPPRLLDAAERAGVDLSAALQRINGKLPVYRRMLAGFIREMTSLPARPRHPTQRDELAAAGRHVHNVKGLAATLGAVTLSACAARAESAVGSPADRALSEAAVDELRASLSAGLPRLRQLLDAVDEALALNPAGEPAGTTDMDGTALGAAIKELLDLLESGDMAATRCVTQVLSGAQGRLGEHAISLEATKMGRDFPRAAGVCRDLLARGLAA